MKTIISYILNDEKESCKKYGLLCNYKNQISEINSLFDQSEVSSQYVRLEDVKLLPPVSPSKIVAVGVNYKAHAEEMNKGLPEDPLLFLKPSTAVIGPNDTILLPKMSKRIDYEAELAIVIKEKAKNVKEDEAKQYILGYTCGNDVTARDLQKKDGQWTRAKSFDTFAPIGPWIVPQEFIDPTNLNIKAIKNGKVVQNSCTSDLIFNPYTIVSYISNIMTLLPGDVIFTGTPSGIGQLQPNDIIEVEIENVGTLKNFVSDDLSR